MNPESETSSCGYGDTLSFNLPAILFDYPDNCDGKSILHSVLPQKSSCVNISFAVKSGKLHIQIPSVALIIKFPAELARRGRGWVEN